LVRADLLLLAACGLFLLGCRGESESVPAVESNARRPDRHGVYHIQPGDNIQAILDDVAQQSPGATIRVHAGTYRPSRYGQALIHFNRQHDGITLEGEGDVQLTAANPAVANRADKSYPAIVNHVVFFGDQVSSNTVLRNVTITGANGFVGTDAQLPAIESNSPLPELQKGLFFYRDGGAIKIFGRSYPTIENVTVIKNRTGLCGAGVSIEHRGFSERMVVFRNCQFRDNHCPATGSAVDVLGGSAVQLDNCLFVGNIANTGMDAVAAEFGLRYKPEHGCGALTVFPKSRAFVRRCTFTANWNGVDDLGTGSVYEDCIFWHNTAGDGSRPSGPYELDVTDASRVRRCFIDGNILDLQHTIDPKSNTMKPSAPDFNERFEPQMADYQGIGYRVDPPVTQSGDF
jgi:hypothetical protein